MQVAADPNHFPARTKLVPLRGEVAGHAGVALRPRTSGLARFQVEAQHLPPLADRLTNQIKNLLAFASIAGRLGEICGICTPWRR